MIYENHFHVSFHIKNLCKSININLQRFLVAILFYCQKLYNCSRNSMKSRKRYHAKSILLCINRIITDINHYIWILFQWCTFFTTTCNNSCPTTFCMTCSDQQFKITIRNTINLLFLFAPKCGANLLSDLLVFLCLLSCLCFLCLFLFFSLNLLSSVV